MKPDKLSRISVLGERIAKEANEAKAIGQELQRIYSDAAANRISAHEADLLSSEQLTKLTHMVARWIA